MRHIRWILLLLMSATVLNADYIRSIRIGSFPNEKLAEASLDKVNLFVSESLEIVELQENHDFVFKYRKSGKYYITLVEPFTDRPTLQKVLNILRLEYPSIYVTKLKKLPIKQATLSIDDTEVTEEIKAQKTIPRIEKIEPVISEVIEVKPIDFKELEEDKVAIEHEDTVINDLQNNSQESNYSIFFQVLSLILFVVLVAMVRYIVIIRRKNDDFTNQEIISREKLDQISGDVTTKDKILSHVSHELRTPMTAIMGLTHLILESELTKMQKDYILKIESSSEHLLNLINDILDVSKIKAGELKLEKTEFNINDILEYVFSVNAVNAKRNSTQFYMDVAEDIPSKVIGDSLRLGQILINLIGNSVKFTSNGEISLCVRKVSTVLDTIKLEFDVIDTGIGMTPEQVNEVFNSYYQATDSTSRKFGGTGLGLSISKELVEMMGGTIKVSSEKDKGTTFTFSVNLNVKDPENKRHYRLPSSSMLNKNILIVDSSDKNVISLMKSLTYFNYKTNSIPSFEESIIEDDRKFDIMVINQYNLTRKAISIIENMQRTMKTKLVVLNEVYSTINSDLIAGLNIDAYLQIPATQQSVLNMIVELYVAKNLDKRSRKTNLKDKLKEFRGKKILVAEDNDVNQKVILGLLNDTGIELTFVDNGHEALDLVRKNTHFDLILMDINMPNMNGYEATIEIRKSDQYNYLPILSLTGDVTDEAVSKALDSGMQGHISKPIVIDIFYKKIYDMLSSKRVDLINQKLMNKDQSERGNEDGFSELSISVGLTRCNGDKEFYKSILKDFKSMYINSAITLEELCDQGAFKDARRMAMDIKDVALNIGAYNLCESAASMEYEFEKGSRSNWRELIAYYDSVFKVLISDIDTYLKQ